MPHEIAHAILTSDILDGDIRTDMRNYVTQVYGEDGIKARGREYMAQIVDGDIMFGTHEGAVALTPEEIADVRSGKRTMSDVMKGKPVEAAERDALINARIDEYNQRSREKGGNDYDWARDEVTAEQFAGEAKGIDFRGIRAGGPKVLESALATSARVLEALGAKFDRTTGKPLDNPSVLFRDNPLFQDRIMQKRVKEYVRAYDQYLVGLEEAGSATPRGVELARSSRPEDMARSTHVKLRDEGRGVLENDFLFQKADGTYAYKPQKIIESLEGGTKPDMLGIGHFHKAEMMPSYRNVAGVQAGTFERQTPFMARGGLAAHVGGWIIDVTVGEGHNVIRGEFVAVYE
jgi:hypothetical protein